jgi:hypothetical protein
MFCIVHYHNEGKALAFKRKDIKTIELQHGLIAATDVFYVFPPQTKSIINKALFADEIWVYGPETDANALRFIFKKTDNPFSNNDYVLQRSTLDKEPWYTAVEYWRQGKIFIQKQN